MNVLKIRKHLAIIFSYGIYLMHQYVLLVFIFSMDTTIYFSMKDIGLMSIGLFTVSSVVSLFLSMYKIPLRLKAEENAQELIAFRGLCFFCFFAVISSLIYVILI